MWRSPIAATRTASIMRLVRLSPEERASRTDGRYATMVLHPETVPMSGPESVYSARASTVAGDRGGWVWDRTDGFYVCNGENESDCAGAFEPCGVDLAVWRPGDPSDRAKRFERAYRFRPT